MYVLRFPLYSRIIYTFNTRVDILNTTNYMYINMNKNMNYKIAYIRRVMAPLLRTR